MGVGRGSNPRFATCLNIEEMTEEPIIDARFKKFIQRFELERMNEDEAFEQFANYSILFQHQPDAFASDSELLETTCVGGCNDNGIDGIAIKVNGFLVKSRDEIDELAKADSLNIEFIFVQSKNKKSFNIKELLTFLNGVKLFFMPGKYIVNEKVQFWIDLKDYLYSDDIMCQWHVEPSIRCYYLALGRWNNHDLHDDSVSMTKNELESKKICSEFNFHFIGSGQLKEILDRNENKFQIILSYIDTMDLPAAEKSKGSCIALCSAESFVKLLRTDEGIIRKSLFNDNVRDYQGENAVNSEIFETISNSPNEFILLNNGITIVCTKFLPSNRKLTIDNPQIVNGCQTSNVLFLASQKGAELDKIAVVLKVISTDDLELSNKIVRGTNRQSIVYEEAFEGTRKFHKNLEEFVNAFQSDFQDKIYYERRAKQYNNSPSIKPTQRVNLKVLIQYSVGVLLCKPHYSHQHESVLLRRFKDNLFVDGHSLTPYFAVMYGFYTLERLIRMHDIDKFYGKWKAHLLMIYFKLTGGSVPDLKKQKSSDEYANNVLNSLYDISKATVKFNEAIKIFNDCSTKWTSDLHRSKYAMKDVPEFTELIIKTIDKVPLNGLINKMRQQQEPKKGYVERVFYNNNKPYGYIKSGNDRFFMSGFRNKDVNFKNLKGKQVSFIVSPKDGKERVQALNVKVE